MDSDLEAFSHNPTDGSFTRILLGFVDKKAFAIQFIASALARESHGHKVPFQTFQHLITRWAISDDKNLSYQLSYG
jgi:hypothetical protein